MPTEYTLSELVKLTGVSPRTVRYYIAQGLLPSPIQQGPNTRYTEAHLDRLRLIKRLQAAHLPLAEIRRRLRRCRRRRRDLAESAPAYDAPADSALDYVQSLLTAAQRAGQCPSRLPATPPAPVAPQPEPIQPDRAQWERITLDPDVELHIRRPLTRQQNNSRTSRSRSRASSSRRTDNALPKPNLKARADRRFIRSTYRSNRFVLAEIKAPHAHLMRTSAVARRSTSRSWSTARARWRARNCAWPRLAVEQSIARLKSTDRFSIVVYDNVIDVVFESDLATPGDQATLRCCALTSIEARDIDQPGRGLAARVRAGRAVAVAEGVNRCLLLTDGLANVGHDRP